MLASEPSTVADLQMRLLETFDLGVDALVLSEIVSDLESQKLLVGFQMEALEVRSKLMEGKFFSLTSSGTNTLRERIEALSVITLTMQLGLKQRITKELEA